MGSATSVNPLTAQLAGDADRGPACQQRAPIESAVERGGSLAVPVTERSEPFAQPEPLGVGIKGQLAGGFRRRLAGPVARARSGHAVGMSGASDDHEVGPGHEIGGGAADGDSTDLAVGPEAVGDRQCRHSALGLLTPVEFETRHEAETVA